MALFGAIHWSVAWMELCHIAAHVRLPNQLQLGQKSGIRSALADVNTWGA